jgi:hypothetical protein
MIDDQPVKLFVITDGDLSLDSKAVERTRECHRAQEDVEAVAQALVTRGQQRKIQ